MVTKWGMGYENLWLLKNWFVVNVFLVFVHLKTLVYSFIISSLFLHSYIYIRPLIGSFLTISHVFYLTFGSIPIWHVVLFLLWSHRHSAHLMIKGRCAECLCLALYILNVWVDIWFCSYLTCGPVFTFDPSCTFLMFGLVSIWFFV